MWTIDLADMTMWSLLFLPNGKMMEIQPRGLTSGTGCFAARMDPPGIEWASYTFNDATGALSVFNPVYDTNGCVGFFDPTAAVPNLTPGYVETMAADGKSFTRPLPDGSIRTYFRVPTQ